MESTNWHTLGRARQQSPVTVVARHHTCRGSVHLGTRSVSTVVKRGICRMSAAVDLLQWERGTRDSKQYSS